jgi:conjugal transfer pilus assembly protein TraD
MLEGYEIAWRPNYERHQAGIWLSAAFVAAVVPTVFDYPAYPSYAFASLACLLAARRAWPAFKNQKRIGHLRKILMDYVKRDVVIKKTEKYEKKKVLWLGWGFEWDTTHAQLAFDLIKRDPSKFIGEEGKNHAGAAWLHGLEQKEHEVEIPLSMLDGQTIIVGTTGAGKTRLLDLIITQAIVRNETVIFLDPKGDKDVMQGMKRTCESIGHPERFVYFHPGFPEDSARIDPLYNFTRATEVASRIAMLIPSESGADPFKAFSQMALTTIISSLMEIGQRPTLVRIRTYLETGVEQLLIKVMEKFLGDRVSDFASQVRPYIDRAKGDKASAYIAFYSTVLPEEAKKPEIEGLIAMHSHDKVHFSKMVTSLQPVLNTLTAGDLGELLSPRNTIDDDPRPLTNSAQMIRQGQAVYMGLDSLSDNIVSSAVGSMIISDITSCAGARYNYGDGMERPVNIIVDELAELINDSLISLLARGRGAKVRVIAATQTVADLSARLGSEDKARQVIANCNNMIALRTPEPKTQQYICESLPKTAVKHIMRTQGSNTDSEVPLIYGSNFGERLMETEKELFSPEYLGLLANFHYIARLTGGRLIKGRIPFVADDDTERR